MPTTARSKLSRYRVADSTIINCFSVLFYIRLFLCEKFYTHKAGYGPIMSRISESLKLARRSKNSD